MLLTDAYQLTMIQSYLASPQPMEQTAVFELFFRKLPANRSFLLAAGLEQAVEYLENLSFTEDELRWLRDTHLYSADFLSKLRDFRFTGDVDAMEEGTPFFPHEPVLRVSAPIAEAQLVESRLINLIHFGTLIASKAARSALATRGYGGKVLVDFGMRRAHGSEAALLAARASFIAGFSGTSCLLAGRMYGIPIFGTMAHSFIEAHASESDAFLRFAETQNPGSVFLLDTYDTEEATRKLAALAPKLARSGLLPRAVRIDSGDLLAHARRVRAILDTHDEGTGLSRLRIFASGGLDEYEIARLLEKGAPIDGFGIGTRLVTSADACHLDCAYKLQEYAGIARRKTSEGKSTLPGAKQVFRSFEPQGRYAHDILTLLGDELPGEPLLKPILRAGKRISPAPSLRKIRAHAARELARLPLGLTGLSAPESPYPVRVSEKLRALARETDLRRFEAEKKNPAARPEPRARH